MEQFKISLFETQNKKDFPSFKTLSESHCKNIIEEISCKFQLSKETIEKDLFAKQTIFNSTHATEGFDLNSTFSNLQIIPAKQIFINWNKFEKIDFISLKDLNKCFYDIWFPSSDDIDLFDETLDWIISVTHFGAIYYLKTVK